MQLHRARAKFDEAGGRLILIGQRTPRDAATFRRRQGIQLPVLADQDLVSYKAAGAKFAGVSDLFSPKVVVKGALTSVREKTIQGKTQGSASLLGGTLVIRPDGQITWSHMSTDASDNAAPEDIIAALRKAAA
jgi:peroxiredoxin